MMINPEGHLMKPSADYDSASISAPTRFLSILDFTAADLHACLALAAVKSRIDRNRVGAEMEALS